MISCNALLIIAATALFDSAAHASPPPALVYSDSQAYPNNAPDASPAPTFDQRPENSRRVRGSYSKILSAAPASVTPTKIEVVEILWYPCPRCSAFEPSLTNWLKAKSPGVEFRRMLIAWKASRLSDAHLYYILNAFGRRDLQQTVYDTLHQQRWPSNTESPSDIIDPQPTFAGFRSIKRENFEGTNNSVEEGSEPQDPERLATEYHITVVPTIIINGRYKIDVGQSESLPRLFVLLNDLITSEMNSSPTSQKSQSAAQ